MTTKESISSNNLVESIEEYIGIIQQISKYPN